MNEWSDTSGHVGSLRLAVDAAPIAIVVVDAAGRLASVNAQAEQLFGYSREEIVGRSIEILVPQRFRGRHPELRGAFVSAPTARPMGAGRDLYGLRRDGSEVPIEIGLSPVTTSDGLFVLAAVIDITERKRAEERQGLVVEAAPNAMVMVNEQGDIVLLNAQAEQLFGYSREELFGTHIDRLIPDRFRDAHPGHRENFFARPSARAMGAGRDLFGLRKDGAEVPIEIGLNPITTAEGRFVLAAIIDITERRRAEELRILNAGIQQHNEQLAALNAELESFSYSVSHDLRAPVRAISGYAQAIAEDYGDRLDAEGNRLLGVVRDEASRMGDLIDDLLDFSRLGREPLEEGEVDMNVLARDVVRKLDPDGLTAVDVGDLPAVRGDVAMLRLVWENLVSNALKYSAKESAPAIRISGEAANGEAVFEVADNGVGFDMRYADKLFGVFQRLHHADEFPGTGVGLATVNRIVMRHDGRAWGEGAVGEGARFYFALPAGAR